MLCTYQPDGASVPDKRSQCTLPDGPTLPAGRSQCACKAELEYLPARRSQCTGQTDPVYLPDGAGEPVRRSQCTFQSETSVQARRSQCACLTEPVYLPDGELPTRLQNRFSSSITSSSVTATSWIVSVIRKVDQ